MFFIDLFWILLIIIFIIVGMLQYNPKGYTLLCNNFSRL